MNVTASQNRSHCSVTAIVRHRCAPSRCPALPALRPAAAVLGLVVLTTSIAAQRPRFPSGTATPIQGGVASSTSPVDIPLTNLTPIAAQASAAPLSPTVSGQLYDPYATGSTSSLRQPALPAGTTPSLGGSALATPFIPSGSTIPPSQPGASLFSRIFSRPASAPISVGYGSPTLQPPYIDAPSVYDAPQGYAPGATYGAPGGAYGAPGGAYGAPSGFGNPMYPDSAYPSQSPTSLYPGGLFNNGQIWNSTNVYAAKAFRLFQGPRLRQTFVVGGDAPQDLGINRTDVSLAFAFPSFLYSSQPLFVVPSFSLDLWDGPQGSTGADLPSKAYGAFLDFGWQSDPNQLVGTEFGMRVGVFSDFDTYNSESIRVMGRGLVNFRLSPTTTVKGGVFYVDRNRYKLIPAFGFICEPNPFTRIDLYFPEPKYSRYCRTVGTRDVWWYLSGDYGGGSWTIQRTDGTSDSIDINDLRVKLGLEWGENNYIRAGRRNAFFEVGYVFDREIIYRRSRQDDINPDNAFMISAGFGY